MNYVLFFSGVLVGAVAVYVFFRLLQSKDKRLIEEQKQLINEIQNTNVRLDAENKFLKDNAAKSEEMQKSLGEKFENLANKIFDEKDKKSTDKIKLVLEPIEKDIHHFRKKIEEMNSGTGERMAKLSEQIRNLQELNREITEETQNLTKALKGDVKKQGNWGELILERLLEMSGLRKDIEYETQTSVNDENDRRQLDVLIKLPENKHLIIDSKVSMLDYEKLIKTDDPEEAERYKKSLSLSIKAHIDGLASKHYQTIKGINSPDYVFMFIPIEGAFSSILEDSMSLYQYAINKNVMIVSPTTLLASLRTVSALWQQENQTKNALEIASESGKLLDKFSLFYEDFKKIGRQLHTVQNSFDDAENKLQTGKGSLVSRAKKIQQMGAKTSKQLPQPSDEE